jgi:hypothetical protein
MSEAELHLLRARLNGGRRSKALRGELRCGLPVGFIYDSSGKVLLDPDRQVQRTLRVFFETFQRVGSCFATVRFFRKRSLLFPRRLRGGPNKGDLLWSPLGYSRALQVLHNPRYAGAFAFGQGRWHKKANGRFGKRKLPREEWFALHRDAHPGYISWEEYERNERRLLECAQSRGDDRRKSPPREGPALLQGLVVCGICGDRMTLRYHGHRHGQLAPDYVCQRRGIERAEPVCQTMAGMEIDQAIGNLLLAAISPMALDVTLAVQREMQLRIEDADNLHQQQVVRAELEVEQARRRYMHVDPTNRLVADSLEADWNQKLRACEEARTLYEQQRAADRATIDVAERKRILALAEDFPAVWRDPKTPQRERKRMVRLMIEDVTLIKAEHITAHVRFRGGAATTLTLPLPRGYFWKRKTRPEAVEALDELLQTHTESQASVILNERGILSGDGQPMNVVRVAFIRKAYGLKTLRDRLHEAGMLTAHELAQRLDVALPALKRWRKRGLLRGRIFNDKGEYMYDDPGKNPAVKAAVRHARRVRPCAPGTRGYRVGGAV